jgi:hypothetical protein
LICFVLVTIGEASNRDRGDDFVCCIVTLSRLSLSSIRSVGVYMCIWAVVKNFFEPGRCYLATPCVVVASVVGFRAVSVISFIICVLQCLLLSLCAVQIKNA